MSDFSSKFGGIFQKKSERPRIRPVRTWIDHLFDFAMLDFVLFGIGYAIWAYLSLPATIPTKFNGVGQVTSTVRPGRSSCCRQSGWFSAAG